MFDIGAPEVLVLLVVALFVFGPDRLPTIARQAGRWVHDLRRMVANARRDLDEHIGVDTAELNLRDLDPRSYVRKNVLDGLGLDDEATGRGRAGPGGAGDRATNGTTPARAARTPPSRPAPGSASPAAGGGPAPASPPYDPDAT